jgi:hypothetical protein
MTSLQDKIDGSDQRLQRCERKHGRIECEDIHCELGQIVDLSAAGMKVKAKGKPQTQPGDVYEIDVGPEGRQVTIRAKVVWVGKRGWRGHEVGLSFNELSREQRAALYAAGRNFPAMQVPWEPTSAAA